MQRHFSSLLSKSPKVNWRINRSQFNDIHPPPPQTEQFLNSSVDKVVFPDTRASQIKSPGCNLFRFWCLIFKFCFTIVISFYHKSTKEYKNLPERVPALDIFLK